MKGRNALLGGLAAIVVGLVGLIVIATVVAAPYGPANWNYGSRGMMGMAGMMGGPVVADASPIGMEQATAAARTHISRLRVQNLKLGEVMEFGANYYAQAIETDTGIHAFELIIDKYTGAVFPEMGPNMAWNAKYGPMGGMMGGRWFGVRGSAEMPIDPKRAQEIARRYLATQGLRLDVGEADRFYGYYTLHTLRSPGNEVEGMLSVHGFTGEVWYHVWHGPFMREQLPR